MNYGTTVRMAVPFPVSVPRVREALAEQGFGILTEIDVRATMKNKLDADMEDYLILGACHAPLAHRALGSDRSIGLLLPCNVVVRSADHDTTIVEFLDPHVIAGHVDDPDVDQVAELATQKLTAARERLVDPYTDMN